MGAFLFYLRELLPLSLLGGHPDRHDTLDVGFLLLEPDTVAGLEAGPLPVHFGTGIILVQEIVVPVGSEIPRAVLH